MNPSERAKEIINKYDVHSPSRLNIEEIANAENLIVEEEEMKGNLGKIIYQDGYGLIKINSGIQEAGQKRFTLAHELGHYCNEKDALTQPLPTWLDLAGEPRRKGEG